MYPPTVAAAEMRFVVGSAALFALAHLYPLATIGQLDVDSTFAGYLWFVPAYLAALMALLAVELDRKREHYTFAYRFLHTCAMGFAATWNASTLILLVQARWLHSAPRFIADMPIAVFELHLALVCFTTYYMAKPALTLMVLAT